MSADVRAAQEAHLEALIQLNQVVQSVHAALYPGDFTQVLDPSAVGAYFAPRLAGPNTAVGLAEAEHRPVGCVSIEMEVRGETAFMPRSRLYVHQIAVAPAARRRRVATALMRYVEHRGASEGIDRIVLNTWTGNVDAQRFFASLGSTAFNVMLRKKLAGPG